MRPCHSTNWSSCNGTSFRKTSWKAEGNSLKVCGWRVSFPFIVTSSSKQQPVKSLSGMTLCKAVLGSTGTMHDTYITAYINTNKKRRTVSPPPPPPLPHNLEYDRNEQMTNTMLPGRPCCKSNLHTSSSPRQPGTAGHEFRHEAR